AAVDRHGLETDILAAQARERPDRAAVHELDRVRRRRIPRLHDTGERGTGFEDQPVGFGAVEIDRCTAAADDCPALIFQGTGSTVDADADLAGDRAYILVDDGAPGRQEDARVMFRLD